MTSLKLRNQENQSVNRSINYSVIMTSKSEAFVATITRVGRGRETA